MDSDLPPLYARWMGRFLGGLPPRETLATCGDCVMCLKDRPVDQPLPPPWFHPATKCCTWIPQLPNFLVGRALADLDPAAADGRATLVARLDRIEGVGPFGAAIPAAYAERSQSSRESFGRDPSLRCPHYLDDGRCGVWRHRASVCATWFCRYERGAVGQVFWKAVHEALAAAEGALSAACVKRFRGEPWTRWKGREAAYYKKCAAWVEGLSWREVRAIGGPLLETMLRELRAAWKELRASTLPKVLRRGSWTIVESEDEFLMLETYRPFHPIRVPRAVYDALPSFDGRPTSTVMMELGKLLDRGLLRRLVDGRVLVEA